MNTEVFLSTQEKSVFVGYTSLCAQWMIKDGLFSFPLYCEAFASQGQKNANAVSAAGTDWCITEQKSASDFTFMLN